MKDKRGSSRAVVSRGEIRLAIGFTVCMAKQVLLLLGLILSQLVHATGDKNTHSLPVIEGFDPEFSLMSTTGGLESPADHMGKIVIVSFGYTSCPDVCPTILSNLAQAIELVGAGPDDASVIFISFDPERDDIEIMQQYMAYFGANFIGVVDTESKIRDVAMQYQAGYEKRIVNSAIEYVFFHTDYLYFLGESGHLRAVLKGGEPIEKIVATLKALLSEIT
jgi:protein SCO1/2